MFVRILPPEVRSRIAAGEVIESPADVVKELLENSLDANATHIEVEVSKGGKSFISVRDNGTGIHPEDIDKVFLEGATSKIETEEDLLNVQTYGFRGEALHSIASVSRLVIKSRYFQELEGWRISVEGGRLVSKEKVGMPVGTEVQVMDLFFNLPPRRRSLKREDTERNRVLETVREYAFVRPEVSFRVFSNGREVLNLPKSDLRERFRILTGLMPEEVLREREGVRIRALIVRNVERGRIYLFVNRRPVKNRSLKEFLRKVLGYKTLAAVFLEVPTFLVDPNVHPKKREVRLQRERVLLSAVREALSGRETLARPDTLAQRIPPYSAGPRVVGQVRDTLIVAEIGDYLYFFDQHLLAERINYERTGKEEEACRSSLKAGERLSREDMEDLLKSWGDLENPHVCPHGRPLYYRVHLKDIYRKLGRPF
jgi:DNA mismatch repair protein MutL